MAEKTTTKKHMARPVRPDSAAPTTVGEVFTNEWQESDPEFARYLDDRAERIAQELDDEEAATQAASKKKKP